MSPLDQARDTQLKNIQVKTGQSLAALRKLIADSVLAKHGEIRSMLIERLGLGYGDANVLVHFAQSSDGQSAAAAAGLGADEVLDGLYAGKKAPLRPIHDKLMQAITAFGEFETAPKKGYVSLRRKKQFAMLGPATNERFELGLNMKGVAGSDRLVEQPAGGMCPHKVKLTDAAQIDKQLIAWAKHAYDSAG